MLVDQWEHRATKEQLDLMDYQVSRVTLDLKVYRVLLVLPAHVAMKALRDQRVRLVW